MGRRKRHQADQRADLRGGGFIGLPTVVHRSAAYRSLPPFERAVLTEIIAAFNGYNNGKIVLSQRQISEALGNSNFRKIGRAIAVLIERGMLDIATEGLWKQRQAREYRLTFIMTGSPPNVRPATNEYLRWQKYDADDALAGTGKSADDVSARAQFTADAVPATRAQKPQKCVNALKSAADDASSLICKPYPAQEKRHGIPTRSARKNAVATFTAGDPRPALPKDLSDARHGRV